MISISVGPAITTTAGAMPSLVLAGLQDGTALVGGTLSASLSDGTTITSHSWGTTPGGADLGSAPGLVVPATLGGGTLYLSAQSAAGLFTVAVSVAASPTTTSVVTPGPEEIDIQSLAPVPVQPSLLPTAGQDAIIVEIA